MSNFNPLPPLTEKLDPPLFLGQITLCPYVQYDAVYNLWLAWYVHVGNINNYKLINLFVISISKPLFCLINIKHWPNVVLMLFHRLRRWAIFLCFLGIIVIICNIGQLLCIICSCHDHDGDLNIWCPTNWKHFLNVVLMLFHRLRRWPHQDSIGSMFGVCWV